MAETKAQFEVVKEEAAKIKIAAADLEQPINDFTSEVLGISPTFPNTALVWSRASTHNQTH